MEQAGRNSEDADEEIGRMHITESFDDEDKPAVVRAVQQVFHEGQAHVEANLLTKSGSKDPVLSDRGPFSVAGVDPTWAGLGLITERRKWKRLSGTAKSVIVDSFPRPDSDLPLYADRFGGRR